MREQSRSTYFINGPIDFLFIGGASIILYLLFRFPLSNLDTYWSFEAAYLMSWLVNWPHFSATSYRLYHSKSNILQYPLTAIGVPILLFFGVLGSFLSPLGIAPFFVKFFTFWSPYHYSGQSLGISLVYCNRAGYRLSALERKLLTGSIFFTFLTATARSETGTDPISYFGITYPRLGIPVGVADGLEVCMYLCALVFLILMGIRTVKKKRLPPWILFLPAIAQYVWFHLGGRLPVFNVFVPLFHSLQYLLIAWSVQLKEKMDQNGIGPSRGYAWKESLQWGTGNFLGGVGLFWILPRLGQLAGFPLSFAEPVLVAAVQIHHFFVDGVIWKLRNPKVRSPLLVNIKEVYDAATPVPA